MGDTFKEHFQNFPEPYRTKALNNLFQERADFDCTCAHHALIDGFNWMQSPEGYDYWQEFAVKLTTT